VNDSDNRAATVEVLRACAAETAKGRKPVLVSCESVRKLFDGKDEFRADIKLPVRVDIGAQGMSEVFRADSDAVALFAECLIVASLSKMIRNCDEVYGAIPNDDSRPDQGPPEVTDAP